MRLYFATVRFQAVLDLALQLQAGCMHVLTYSMVSNCIHVPNTDYNQID